VTTVPGPSAGQPPAADASAVQAVLFDLDGTLIDSAPDLAGAANDLRERRGLPPLPFAALRPMVGAGARGMVGVAFGLAPGDEGYEPLRDAFLTHYESRLLRETHVFPAVVPLLGALDAARRPWGIVTNKASRYAMPVVRGLPALSRHQVLIAGDTTPHAKPHPEPLLEAARRLGVAPEACVYVGDDQRDIVAARAAGMRSAAALWGYLGSGAAPTEWGADVMLAAPGDLLELAALA
jgi:phosphoglycolate phosphatase